MGELRDRWAISHSWSTDDSDACYSLPGTSHMGSRDLSPLSASGYIDQALEVQPPGNDTTFRVYLTAPAPSMEISAGPSAASGSSKSGNGTYLVCHHGAGSGGLSFAAMAKYVKELSRGEMGVLAFDCRGHGQLAIVR